MQINNQVKTKYYKHHPMVERTMVQEGLLKPDFSIHRKVSNDLVFASLDLTEKERKKFYRFN